LLLREEENQYAMVRRKGDANVGKDKKHLVNSVPLRKEKRGGLKGKGMQYASLVREMEIRERDS